MNRRQAFQASRDPSHPRPGGGGGGSLLFLFFPLALLFYVWNTVQEEPTMADPRDAIFKLGGGAEIWDLENDTDPLEDGVEEDAEEATLWSVLQDENEEAQLREDMDDQIPLTGLWILVESWQPGLPHWQQALAELVVLAHTIHAVLVEPEIAQAALVPCHQGVMPLSHIYNRTRMLQFYPLWASCTKYDLAMNQLTAPKIFNVCFHPNSDDCELETYYQEPINDVLEDAMDYSQNHPHNMVLVRFHHVWKSSFNTLTLPVRPKKKNQPPSSETTKRTLPIIDHAMVTTFQTQHLEFAARHYQLLDAQLQAKGISHGSYAVIHWNPLVPSSPSDDATHCVNAILQVKQAMNLPLTTPFFIIATIPHVDSDHSDNRTLHHPALASLYQDHSFLRLETMLPSLQDKDQDAILGIVMNFILAEQALSFTTCITTTTTSPIPPDQLSPSKWKHQPNKRKSCHAQFPFCETCHAGGIFGEWALASRHPDHPNTLPCWPQTSSELPAIHSLWKQGGGS